MSNAYRFIHRHTRNTLVARGWPAEMDIQTNLSYSQGDGVAFYGRLSANELVLLLPEIALRGLMDDGAMRTLRDLIVGSDMTVTLFRNSLGNHYAHSGTISMEYDDCPEGMYERHAVSLLKALRAEINNVCSCVAAAGYRVLEAFSPSGNEPIFSRQTRNFRLTVTEVEPFDDGDCWDNEALDRLLAAILDENTTYRSLEVSLESRGMVLGRLHVPYAWNQPGLPVRRWFEREWLREVVKEARSEIDAMMVAMSGIRPSV
jgi:hypothetical protein